jgi:Lipid-droplet associated hydrolase
MSSPPPENAQHPAEISFHPISEDPSESHHLIYFITGNPGLISYYNTFFQTLHELLTSSTASASNIFHIHGQSLAGFEDDATKPFRLTPYSLENQISHSLSTLQGLQIPSGPKKSQPYTSVVLIGHSVGSYILLELINRLRKSSSPLTIKAGILLFPTVTHIAQSPSGIKVSTLFKVPDFPRRASFLARNLVSLVPRNWLKWLVAVVTKMPDEAAEITTTFLRSRMGIWQALWVLLFMNPWERGVDGVRHMAKDEMEQITEDKWDEDIWGAEHEDTDHKYRVPKLVFYFGEKVRSTLGD